ncbi:ATP-dependent DNA helicase DDX11-like [Acanthaster planci]|uniref:ATP-dependent DNA helicase DDX11-like n=1 Tax=Acanthaster planci TaxID=133434 RepID=A0A8B7Y0L7_ACAPL|nr:ATP-dependent DNA helicase DDX11-like [Acanthaster planci]XP_022086710.1 ATP-dependent DNA helicase DDX11-like [Acanthaster planci]
MRSGVALGFELGDIMAATQSPPAPVSVDPDVSMSSACDDMDADDEGIRPIFPFPFDPYPIQEDFMRALYRTIEEGKIGIFESPTGTGKSLSLICGALKWLSDHQTQQRLEVEAILKGERGTPGSSNLAKSNPAKPSSSAEPDWVLEFDNKRAQMEKAALLMEEQQQLMKREAKLQQMRQELKHKATVKRKRLGPPGEFDLPHPSDENDNILKPPDADDESILVADYHSDEETRSTSDSEEEEEEEGEPHVTKIFYCSRTHSQLSQFVHEVQKSPFGETTKVVTLGSRQNLCINEAVKKLKSLSLINDRCLEMQKKKKEKMRDKDGDPGKSKRKKEATSGCPFYAASQMDSFKDRAVVEVLDLEQLLKVGRELKACPYYGTRYAIPGAELVVLPYNTLLHESTRNACGIRLDGNIVIIDEAHNLIETISNVYSVEVTGGQLCRAHSQLNQYMTKYRSRLKAKNLMYIKQILQVLSGWIRCLGGKVDCPPDTQKTGPETSQLYTINDFLFATQIDNINLFKLQKYCEVSQISRKLNGFIERYQPSVKIAEADSAPPQSAMTRFLQELSQKPTDKQTSPSAEASDRREEEWQTFSSPLLHIEGFLLSLTNADKDGRVVIHKQEILSKCSIKFLLLNPAVHFTQVLQKARAVIVAGGTMQPVDEFKQQLLYCGGVDEGRIVEFSCGHVIPPEQLLPIALAKGPSGVELDFTYQSRDLPKMMDEVGRVLINVSNVVPGGIVCFLPSYDYEKRLFNHWDSTSVIKRIEMRKRVFREPRKAGQADFVLGQYASFIEKCSSGGTWGSVNGAILLCVVGAKMSEGINFSDDLGRCVIMVGLPYANIKSPELKEKMDYLNATMPPIDGKSAGQQHYDNICMKAVNQSIGRAIRHKGDYATILLLDQRYARPSVQGKLPGWIRQRMQITPRFGPAFAMISKFFVTKRPSAAQSSESHPSPV